MNTAARTEEQDGEIRIDVDVFEDNTPEVGAVNVRVTDTMLWVTLTDGREIGYPLNVRYMRWLANAAPEQKANWQIMEPGGWVIYWPDLDDGIEVVHLLAVKPITPDAVA